MKSLKKQYRDLEMQVMALLRDSVNNSEIESEHINEKAIEVSVYGFNELTIVHDQLTFLDAGGQQYSVYSECDLEDLIDILNA